MLYSKKVMEHCAHPRNVDTIENADDIGEVAVLGWEPDDFISKTILAIKSCENVYESI